MQSNPIPNLLQYLLITATLIILAVSLSACSPAVFLATPLPYTPAPRPRTDATPQLFLAPESGYAGTFVDVNGTGWQPNDTVFIKLADATGRSSVLTAALVESDGTFNTGFLYPTSQRWLRQGVHAVVAEAQNATQQATVGFVISPPEDVTIAAPALLATVEVPTIAITSTLVPVATPTVATAVPTATTATPTAIIVTPTTPITAPTIITATATVAPPVAVNQPRPSNQGVFRAQSGAAILDGSLDEWPNNWSAIGNVVYGGESYIGAGDASGEFQVQWTEDGLFIAVRVRDDVYRSGPDGTNMWQGDSLEIHFDGQLAGDYTITDANADDYQVGVSFGPVLNELRGYRWLPENREGAFGFIGAVQPTADGYQVELILPWYILDLSPENIYASALFGFNISLSDNDAAAPAQQTIVSASPVRTNHRTPTEWGTLILQ